MAKLERKSMPKEEKVNNTSHFLPIACMVSDSLLCWIISRDSNETFFFLHDSKITKIKPSIKKKNVEFSIFCDKSNFTKNQLNHYIICYINSSYI